MLRALLKTMRPKQWTKNAFVFAALIFDEKLFQPAPLLKTSLAFAAFCLISGAVYLINDLVDVEKDRQHPTKRLRPLPSGELSPQVALAAAIFFMIVSLPVAYWLDGLFSAILFGYLLLMIAYSFWLKHIPIIDVLTIATGFVLRVGAGVTVVDVARFSPWLYVCTTLLALFLGVSKRRQELVLLGDNAGEHRGILNHYNLKFMDELIALVTSTTIIAYALYTFSAPNLPPNHTMMLTVPFVMYGIFRYLYLIHVRGETGAPDELLLKDRPLFAAIALWGLAVVAILYLS